LNELTAQHPQIMVIEQENLGSSGGQYTGGKAAYELGYE
jgi:GT2 family glycosyltransferase